jgi:hypothetical protein
LRKKLFYAKKMTKLPDLTVVTIIFILDDMDADPDPDLQALDADPDLDPAK